MANLSILKRVEKAWCPSCEWKVVPVGTTSARCPLCASTVVCWTCMDEEIDIFGMALVFRDPIICFGCGLLPVEREVE